MSTLFQPTSVLTPHLVAVASRPFVCPEGSGQARYRTTCPCTAPPAPRNPALPTDAAPGALCIALPITRHAPVSGISPPREVLHLQKNPPAPRLTHTLSDAAYDDLKRRYRV